MLDSGAPFYQTYETADGKFMSVGAIEGRFYAQLLEGLGLDPSALPHQNDMSKWPEMTGRFAEIFKTKTRGEWREIFDGKDACVAPVLELNEVDQHSHNKERSLLIELDDVLQPIAAPRLSRTPGNPQKPGTPRGTETREVLEEVGYSTEEIEILYGNNIVE
jgi:alpha-methylacyl-CoA racemase